MSQFEKLLFILLNGQSDQQMRFDDLVKVLVKLGFDGRQKGSHHIFWKDGISEIVNLQPAGDLSKAYQVKQVRELIVKYKLVQAGESHEPPL